MTDTGVSKDNALADEIRQALQVTALTPEMGVPGLILPTFSVGSLRPQTAQILPVAVSQVVSGYDYQPAQNLQLGKADFPNEGLWRAQFQVQTFKSATSSTQRVQFRVLDDQAAEIVKWDGPMCGDNMSCRMEWDLVLSVGASWALECITRAAAGTAVTHVWSINVTPVAVNP